MENKVTNVALFPGVVVLVVEVTVYFSLLSGAVIQPKPTPFVLAQWKHFVNGLNKVKKNIVNAVCERETVPVLR